MPETLTDPELVRERLRSLGRRRADLLVAQRRLLADTIKALVTAHGVVPITEAAQLAGVARSTAYEALEQGEGDDRRRREATAAP
jgi:hypothetical protein